MNTKNIRFASNRVRDIESQFHHELDSLYGQGEVEAFITLLFEHIFGWSRVRRMTSREACVDQSDLLKLHWALEELTRQRPIQHIIGHADFCGCRIKVSPDVLIPRPETEGMVEFLIRTSKSGNQKSPNSELRASNYLDLCTGSGCIAIALKKAFPRAEVTAVDLSEKALAVAQQNAENNNVAINFIQADLLDSNFNFQFSIFNFIVSNPPYVRESERAAMYANVLDYEPEQALFVPDDDPLRFYRAIANIAKERLAKDGLLVAEINEAFAKETCALLSGMGFSPAVHTDFRGRPRWISAKKIVYNL